jgi:hypothetical protein
MSIVFEPASEEIRSIINQVMHESHKELVDAGVTVEAILRTKFDKNDEEIPSLKCHGASAYATVKVVKRKQRTYTDHDAQIEIDHPVWKTLGGPQKKALIDHELTHLIVKYDKESKPKRDDLDRPIIGMRPDDFTLTGFLEIVERHGIHALEYGSVTRIAEAVARAAAKIASDLQKAG